MRHIDKITKWFTKAVHIFDIIVDSAASFSGGLIIFSMLLISADVVMRYFLNKPLIWSDVITESIIVGFTFLGASWVLKRGRHVRVDILVNRLNPVTQALATIFSSFVGIIVCLVLFVFAIRVSWHDYVKGYTTAGSFAVPISPIQALVAIGCLLLLFQFIRIGYENFKTWKMLKKGSSALS